MVDMIQITEQTHYSNICVSEIRLNRPECHNAFNRQMIEEITEAFKQLGNLSKSRAVLLKASGKSFSAGADLHWMQSMVDYTYEENCADATRLAHMMSSISNCPKPTIAYIQGSAFGGGVGLVSACDISISLSSAQFCLSEVKLGILPAVILPYVIQKIGLPAAKRYSITAERFSAETAKDLGLVTELAASEHEANEILNTLIQALSKTSPDAVKQCKKLIGSLSPYFTDWQAVDALTTDAIARQRVSNDGQEGMRAFLEKRTPNWL